MDGLSEYDLYKLCTNNVILKRNLAGILPWNYTIWKKDIEIDSYYIINNSASEFGGDHWLMIYYGKDKVTFFTPTDIILIFTIIATLLNLMAGQ